MRVLLVASPMVGHVLPLVPLAGALRDAGHDVVVATAADAVAPARALGLEVHDVAPGFDLRKVFVPTALRHPVLAVRSARGDPGTVLVGHLFAPVAERMAHRLVALADEWRPDLVVHEPLAAAGSLVAARRDVPVVLVDMALFDARELRDSAASRIGPLARRYGVDRIPAVAEVLVTAPPSVTRASRGRPMRHVPVTGDRPAPEELTRPGPRPRIIVTRSTVDDPRPDPVMRRVAAAAAGADVDVVLVRPDPRAARTELPPNVRTTDWLPFPTVFPAAAGVVHHGGAGTLLTALAAGVPQLVVPGAGDRTVHAELVAARGAGLAVPAKDLTAAHLERLVSDPGLARAAREVAAEMAAMPAPRELVEPLAALAGTVHGPHHGSAGGASSSPSR
jgi:UDP:flavonoid glycosyltransferase YjiC (YdhE family)